MGEIAEMMIDGTLCEGCGEYIGDGHGFARYCSRQCAEDRGVTPSQKSDASAPQGKPLRCPHCPRRFRTHDAYLDHFRAKHDRAPVTPDDQSLEPTMQIPRVPSDMLADLRRVVASENIGGAAPRDYAEHRRLKALQSRKLIKYFDRKRPRWDHTFYVATGYGHREVARLA